MQACTHTCTHTASAASEAPLCSNCSAHVLSYMSGCPITELWLLGSSSTKLPAFKKKPKIQIHGTCISCTHNLTLVRRSFYWKTQCTVVSLHAVMWRSKQVGQGYAAVMDHSQCLYTQKSMGRESWAVKKKRFLKHCKSWQPWEPDWLKKPQKNK